MYNRITHHTTEFRHRRTYVGRLQAKIWEGDLFVQLHFNKVTYITKWKKVTTEILACAEMLLQLMCGVQ